jgi:hypothetical protein
MSSTSPTAGGGVTVTLNGNHADVRPGAVSSIATARQGRERHGQHQRRLVATFTSDRGCAGLEGDDQRREWRGRRTERFTAPDWSLNLVGDAAATLGANGNRMLIVDNLRSPRRATWI